MNIFDGVLNKENNVTEILKNLLSYKCFKDTFCEFLEIENNFTSDDIFTQFELYDEKNKKKFGIADLYIEAENAIYIIEIKTKIFTSLTDKQEKNTYLDYINNQSKKGEVIYLIPKHFFEKNKIKGKTKYWEDFILNLKKENLDKINIFINDFVKFFVDYYSIGKVVNFNYNELKLLKGERMNDLLKNLSVPSLLKKLFGIVEEIVESLELTNKQTDKYQDPDFYGYKIKCNDKDTEIWIGSDYNVWEQRSYPLIIWVETDEKIGKKLLKIGFEEFNYDNEMAYIYNIDIIKKDVKIDDLKSEVEIKVNEIKNIISKAKNIK